MVYLEIVLALLILAWIAQIMVVAGAGAYLSMQAWNERTK